MTLYVSNIEETEANVNLKIRINDSTVIDDVFKYSRVTPNYSAYSFSLKKGIYKLTALKENRILLTDTVDLRSNTFFYISYGKEKGVEEKIYSMKTRTNHKLH